ncbi:MAG: hypothetical protein OXN81_02190, partial [Alphaproteobacteria bacterium]|nr:hypothetical protein [Alphaproteobacteria bacterium]
AVDNRALYGGALPAVALGFEVPGAAAALHGGAPYRPLGPRHGLLVAPDWDIWRQIETDLIRRVSL